MYLTGYAEIARHLAYVPYSGFKVGAAVLCDNGEIISAANIEASATSRTGICAEILALSICRLGGHTPVKIAIISDLPKPMGPCGICRQFMVDFSPLEVIMANLEGDTIITTANKLLPNRYTRSAA